VPRPASLPRAQDLKKAVASCEELLGSADVDHIDKADKDKVGAEITAIRSWLADKEKEQAALPLHADPVLRSADLDGKREALNTLGALLKKPKPVKKPDPEPPAPAAAPAAANGAAAPAAAPAAEDMQVD